MITCHRPTASQLGMEGSSSYLVGFHPPGETDWLAELRTHDANNVLSTTAGDSYLIAIIYSRGLSELSGAFDSYLIAISADSLAISLIAILDSYRVAIAP